MSKHILDNLLGSRARAKLLKFLFRNYPNGFSVRELALRTREPATDVKRELAMLRRIGAVVKRQ